jgi:hypothetical protein
MLLPSSGEMRGGSKFLDDAMKKWIAHDQFNAALLIVIPETLVNIYLNAACHMPEDKKLRRHRHENLASLTKSSFSESDQQCHRVSLVRCFGKLSFQTFRRYSCVCLGTLPSVLTE